jgi:hypothetical protein
MDGPLLSKKVSTKIHQKCPREFTQKMSTQIHPKRGILVDKNVHESHEKCPRELNHIVHENLPFKSTRVLPPEEMGQIGQIGSAVLQVTPKRSQGF